MAKNKTVNRETFYPAIRHSIFGGRLQQKQVDGMNYILAVWDSSTFEDLRWLAYMLGTTYHETGSRMQPIIEQGGTAYFTNLYDIQGRRPGVARSMGNTQPGDGAKYRGRGLVQITWKNNYARAGKLLGLDLVNKPDLALKPDIAAKIMFEGMTDASIVFEDHQSADPAFSFTGKTLEDYFSPQVEDWINARRIINGTDHAIVIAQTAKDFYDALEYA